MKKIFKFALALVAASILGCGETNNDVNINQPIPGGSPINPIGRLEFYVLGTNFNSGGLNMFRVDSQTGTLSPVTGQPFAPGASVAQAAYSPASRCVFMSDSITSNLLGFRVDGPTGVLTALPGFPQPSLANATVAVDFDGDELYVPGENSIDGFRVNTATGATTRMAGFPLTVPGLLNAQIGKFAPNGFFYVTDLDSDQIFTFSHDETSGALTLVNAQLTGSQDPTGIAFDETGRFLYVNHRDGTLQGFSFATNGALTRVTPTAVSYGAPGQLAYSFSVRDRILYIGDTVGNNLNAFTVGAGGGLTPVAGYPVAGAGGNAAVAYPNPLTPYLYVARLVSNQITAFRIDSNGGRTPVPGSPFPGGGAPTSLIPIEATF